MFPHRQRTPLATPSSRLTLALHSSSPSLPPRFRRTRPTRPQRILLHPSHPLDRFWWPSLEQDVTWFINICHQCQLRRTTKIRILPTFSMPAPLFHKVYVDAMVLPPAHSFRYITQARCSPTAWPEWRPLRTETGRTLGAFLFEEVLCRWGAVEEIVAALELACGQVSHPTHPHFSLQLPCQWHRRAPAPDHSRVHCQGLRR